MKITKSKIGAILFTILIGAIGSGFWQNILQPLLSHLTRYILNIATFGAAVYKNDIYTEIAKGFCEKPSVSLLCLSIGAFIGFMLSGFMVSAIVNPFKNVIASDKKRKIISFLIILYIIFVSVFSLVYASRIMYINGAVTYFRQIHSVILPYITPSESNEFISQFAQIRNKNNYGRIIDDMRAIASRNKQKLPDYDIW